MKIWFIFNTLWIKFWWCSCAFAGSVGEGIIRRTRIKEQYKDQMCKINYFNTCQIQYKLESEKLQGK